MQSCSARLLIFERPGPSAHAIKARLRSLGYDVGADDSDETPRQEVDLAVIRIDLLEQFNSSASVTESDIRKNLPVILLATPDDSSLMRHCRSANVYGYLFEPFDDPELETVIESALIRFGEERKLRESELWLRSTLDAIGYGIVGSDIDWRVRFINPAAEQLTGWISDEAIGRELSEVVQVSISSPESVRSGKAHGLLRNRGGTEIPIEETSTMIRDENGKVIGSVVTIASMFTPQQT
jgi:PAS domain S-box-containing protein